MDKEFLEKVKGLSREERLKIYESKKAELTMDDLENVNGGVGSNENPNSDCPDGAGNWWTSWNFICHGQIQC